MNSPTHMIFRTAKQHPRATLSLAALVARRRKRTTKIIRLARQSSNVYARMSDAAVQEDVRAAATNLARTIERAQKIGPRQIAGDKKIAKESEAAIKHLSKALANARKAKRHRTLRRIVFVAGLSAGGAIGAWKLTQAGSLLLSSIAAGERGGGNTSAQDGS
jgi:hypothetical protein